MKIGISTRGATTNSRIKVVVIPNACLDRAPQAAHNISADPSGFRSDTFSLALQLGHLILDNKHC